MRGLASLCLLFAAIICGPLDAFAEDILITEDTATTTPTEEFIPEEDLSSTTPEETIDNISFASLTAPDPDGRIILQQDTHEQEIVFEGAGGGERHVLQPSPTYRASGAGSVSSVSLYLARNDVTNANSFSIELLNPETNAYICTLVYGAINGNAEAKRNFEDIPIGDDPALITFENTQGNCTLTEEDSYKLEMIYRVNGNPRSTNGIIYTKGVGSDFFIEVHTTDPLPEPPPPPVDPPTVPGTILSKSIDAAWNPPDWDPSIAYAYNVSISNHLVQDGILTHIAMPLGYYFNDPERVFSFFLKDAFGGSYDCHTPEKTLTEWGVANDTKGHSFNQVTIGPFTGTECDTSLRDVPSRGNGISLAVTNGTGGNLGTPGYRDESNNVHTPFIAYTEDPCLVTSCTSNVLFLPGIKGSRLYGGDELLWEPDGNDDVRQLFLDLLGVSIRNDIHTKKADILTSAFGVVDFYESFLDDLYTLYDQRTINDFEPVAYDWRLSLDDIINNGMEVDENIFYDRATTTPYIEQTLRRLAASSQTGKVTIIAHSNGGLVTKALLQKLGDTETERLVDKVVFVAVPQSGAPRAIGAVLHGDREEIPEGVPLLVSSATARAFAENSPMAYHLLPSARYFLDVQDGDHPVIQFMDSPAYQTERDAYGQVIANQDELRGFLLAEEGGRNKPAPEDTERANVLNFPLLEYAKNTHDVLDSWTPPESVTVYQIAGWGLDTISGIDYYEQCGLFGCEEKYRPMFTEDGDAVVPIPSTLMLSGENTEKFWFDLRKYNDDNHDKNHGNILEIQEIQDFLFKNILEKKSDTVSIFISNTQPGPNNSSKKLRFFLHSPLTLELYDQDGNHLGINENGSIDRDIPGAEYGEFGEVKYITAESGKEYKVVMSGQGVGTFSLDIQEVEDGQILTTTTIADVPSNENTLAYLTIRNGVSDVSPLSLDENGDGTIDSNILFDAGKTTFYEEPLPISPQADSSSGGGRTGSVLGIATSTIVDLLNTSTSSSLKTIPLLEMFTKNTEETLEKKGESVPSETILTNETVQSPFQWLKEMLYNFSKWLLNLFGIRI